jgi:hypothetical protein
MAHEMDQMCSTVVIAVVVILICMGYVEMSKMRPSYFGSSGACGRKSNIKDSNKLSVSAKEVNIQQPNLTGKTTEKYSMIDADWDLNVDESSKCKHEEFAQDEKALQISFDVWQADEEVTAKFVEAAPDKLKAKKAAVSRPLSLSTEFEEPTQGRKLGLTSFRDLYDGKTGSNAIVFSDKGPEWGGSDAHFSARSKGAVRREMPTVA